jgi:hypothetical protein
MLAREVLLGCNAVSIQINVELEQRVVAGFICEENFDARGPRGYFALRLAAMLLLQVRDQFIFRGLSQSYHSKVDFAARKVRTNDLGSFNDLLRAERVEGMDADRHC